MWGPLPHKTDMMFVLRWSGEQWPYGPPAPKDGGVVTKEKKRHSQGRANLVEKLKIIFSYGADLLRGKQIMNPDRF